MAVRLFSEGDFRAVAGGDALRAIMDRARRVENERVAPTLSERRAMTEVALDFVRERGRVVYGGYAMNVLIGRRDAADAFYDPTAESPDLEFYSATAVQDVRALADRYDGLGYPYVRATEAMHADTYKLTVNLMQVCDVSHMPANIERAIPHILVDGVRYAHPHYLLIDSLRILTDPVTSYWRLDKAFPRIYALQKHYPWPRPARHEANLREALDEGRHPDVERAVAAATGHLASGLADGQVAVIVGIAAFERFRRWVSPAREVAGPRLLEVVVTDYAAVCAGLFEHLGRALGPEVQLAYVEHCPLADYAGAHGDFVVAGRLAVRVFHDNHKCTPVLPLRDDESKTLRTAAFSVVALYLLLTRLLCRVSAQPDRRGQAWCDSLLYELYDMRRRFLAAGGLDVLGEHPFREFVTECVGRPVSVARLHKEDTERRRTHPGQFGMAFFKYDPRSRVDVRVDLDNFRYADKSGGPAARARDQLFRPDGGATRGSAAEPTVSPVARGLGRSPRHRRRHNNNRGRGRRQNFVGGESQRAQQP